MKKGSLFLIIFLVFFVFLIGFLHYNDYLDGLSAISVYTISIIFFVWLVLKEVFGIVKKSRKAGFSFEPRAMFDYVREVLRSMPDGESVVWRGGEGKNMDSRLFTDNDGRNFWFTYFLVKNKDSGNDLLVYIMHDGEGNNKKIVSIKGNLYDEDYKYPWKNFDPFNNVYREKVPVRSRGRKKVGLRVIPEDYDEFDEEVSNVAEKISKEVYDL